MNHKGCVLTKRKSYKCGHVGVAIMCLLYSTNFRFGHRESLGTSIMTVVQTSCKYCSWGELNGPYSQKWNNFSPPLFQE